MSLAKIKKRIKRFLGSNLMLPLSKGNKFIFVFHDVSNPHDKQYSAHYSTTIEKFKELIDLFQNLFEIVPLADLVEEGTNLDKQKNYAAITFDDGFYSVYEYAHPILKEKQIPYTIFLNKGAIQNNQLWVSNLVMQDAAYRTQIVDALKVNTQEADPVATLSLEGHFGKEFIDNYKIEEEVEKIYLDEQDLQILLKDGVFFGSHTADHPALSQCADEAFLIHQIQSNKEYLEQLLGQEMKHFALPFGKKDHYNEQVLAKLKQSGHAYIYTTNPNRVKINTPKDYMTIPRIAIGNPSDEELMFMINRSFFKEYQL